MRLIVLLFLFYTTRFSFSQDFKGRILDLETNKGIEYAHVIYTESFKGAISDSLGYFRLPQIKNEDSLIITCIGYSDTIVKIDETVLKQIKLKTEIIEIEEVKSYGSKLEKVLRGCKKKNPKQMTFSNGIYKELGFILYFPKTTDSKISSCGIHIKEIVGKDLKLHFRFITPDSSFIFFGRDNLNKYLSIDKVKVGWNDINLMSYPICTSSEGIIIQFFFSGIDTGEKVRISGVTGTDYTWVSSSDYMYDFPLQFGKKKYRPAVRLEILE